MRTMFKLMITVALFLHSLLQTECLYAGDVCDADGESGRCIPLQECQYLVQEIKKAGSPMPINMRRKLQKLTCGFVTRGNEPLVCCAAKPVPNDDSINSVSSDDSVEPFTRATIENKNGPIIVEGHPNLGLLPRQCGNIESDRIIGGDRTGLFEMPWMVLLSYKTARGSQLSCSGTLINEWYVLTAAHCVAFVGNKMQLDKVILGEHDIRQDPDCGMSDGVKFCAPKIRNVSIASVVAHPGYTRQTLLDDIALIRLAEPADFTLDNMKPICLPVTRDLQMEPLVGKKQNSVVAGWGVTEEGLQSPVLLSVELPVISRQDCISAYNDSLQIKQTQICAGGVKNKDSCSGDSGGPLMFPGRIPASGSALQLRYVQRGVVSFGSKICGLGGYPGIYTNIAYYMKWILDNMQS